MKGSRPAEEQLHADPALVACRATEVDYLASVEGEVFLSTLPGRTRDVAELLLEGFEIVEEIASLLDVSPRTVAREIETLGRLLTSHRITPMEPHIASRRGGPVDVRVAEVIAFVLGVSLAEAVVLLGGGPEPL